MKKILLSSALCAAMAYGDAASVLPVEKRTFDQSKYIPDISAILDFSYVHNSVEDAEIGHLEIPGVAHGLLGSHAHGEASHATYNSQNGFNLNYAEILLSSSVDPFLSMDAVLHFSEQAVAIEEAYFTTTALGNGLRVRGGKLNSNFGYLNAQHHHYWDFGDMPLVYESFLGMHGINELGAQVQWTAPTPFYLMAGFEVLQGENEKMFGNTALYEPEGHDEHEEEGEAHEEEHEAMAAGETAPSLMVAYLKTSYDIGDTTFLGGISYASGSSRLDHSTDEEPHSFSGDSKLYGADLVVLHSIDSYKSVKWQSEWLSREMDGTQFNFDPESSPSINKKQSGLYSQLIYTHDKNWKMGLRYDTIYQNDVKANGVMKDLPNDFNKYSAMVEYHTSEFARFRLQYNNNEAMYNEDGNRQSVNSIILQANIAIGAHSAHSF